MDADGSQKLTEDIERLIMPCIKKLFVELIELRIKHRGKTVIVDVTADKPQGGITLGECSIVNKHIAKKIEEKGLIEDPYEVEVASPGLDRPLVTEKDFTRVIGRSVRFHLLEPIEEKCE